MRSKPGRDAGVGELGLGHLALRGRRRVDDHRVDAPERGGQLGQGQRIDDRAAGLAPAGHLDREHPARDTRPELAHGDVVLGVAREAGVEDALHAVLTFEPGRECRRRSRVALDADGEGQDPAQDEERVEGADGGAGVDLDLLRPAG